jgi:hypothetical protein
MRNMRAGLALVMAIGLGACGSGAGKDAPTPGVTEDEARSMAESMLEAYNSGDYDVWSRDWSDAMKAAIDRETFESFREQTLPVTGSFVEITSVELKPGEQDPDVARFEFRTTFERDDEVVFMIASFQGARTSTAWSSILQGRDRKAES